MASIQDDASQVVRQHVGSPCQVIAMERIHRASHRGFENWLLLTKTNPVLLKLIAPGRTTETRVGNIVIALEIVARCDIPAPELIGFGQQNHLFSGKHYILLGYVAGQDARHALSTLTDQERSEFFVDLGRTIGHLHRIPVSRFSDIISDKTRQRTYQGIINDKLDRLTGWCLETNGIDCEMTMPLIEGLRDRFNALEVVPEPALVHGDLTPDNLLVCDHRFCRLLDFERSEFFDPCSDVAKLATNVFDPSRDDDRHFFSGYRGVLSLGDDYMARLNYYVGLELLMGYVYWTYMQEHETAKDRLERLRRWTETFV
jgi:aminoglycoside phosphotransferase (APT) family kinase protein